MKSRRIIGILCIVIGLCLTSYGAHLISQKYNPNTLAFRIPRQYAAPIVSSGTKPIALKIPSLNLFVRIVPSHIRNGTWETTEEGVSYLLNSPLPGTTGNSILYGHNWESLLGKLEYIKPGSKVIVIYPGNILIPFTVTGKTTVSPQDYQILAKSSDSRITLYTCSGFLDSKRLVVTAQKDDRISKNLTQSHE